ncbi:thioesterase [Paludisphaera soli]|uniref:thioesterase n=1 Tax=Paludisphaera soli TaxID=2712865 RepID=UPI0013EB8DE4|nr:thioesterase [Paludisphaera soli]
MGKAISKAAAVRDALEQGEESPDDGVAYIKKIHGIEISKQMFSSYKTKEKTRQSENQQPAAPKGKPGRKPNGETAPEPRPAPAARPAANGEPDLIEAMEAMQPLVASLGADKVKRIVDLLG